MMDLLGAQAAMSATRRIAHSALPCAPTVAEPRSRTRRATARRTVAHGLRRLAERVEPRPAADCC